jgi:hypothetical protein
LTYETFEEFKGVIKTVNRRRTSNTIAKRYMTKIQEEAKEATRIRKSKKNRQHNGQKKKYKRTNNRKCSLFRTI